ncbi:MAG: MFS transporter [Pseudomonadota bacterium]
MAPANPRLEILALGLATFISMLGVGILVPILPVWAKELGASAFVLGLIFSSFSASRAVVVPYVGALSDRFGRKRFLEAGLLGYAVLALALVWTTTPGGIILNRAVQGVFAALIMPVSMAMVADLAPGGFEGRSFGSFNTWFLLGFGVGPVLGGLVYDLYGVEANFLLMAGLCLVSLGLVTWLVREAPAEQRVRESTGWGRQLALVRDRRMLGICLCRVGQTFGMGSYIAFLPVLGAGQGCSTFEVGLLLTINVLVMTGLQPIAGRLADRWPRLGLAVAATLAASLGKGLMPLAGGFTLLLACNVAEGLGSGLALPPLTALATVRGRQLGAGMGLTMGLYTMALSVGVLFGPILAGLLADLGGLDAAFYLAAAVNALGAGALWWLGRGTAEPPAPG